MIKVFLSVGRVSTPRQEDFVRGIETYLEANNLQPQTVGRTYFSSKQPLVTINELMAQCSGTIVVAFERLMINAAVERRGSDKETLLKDVRLPTVWNQIEATIAYARGHPLLVIVESGLKGEGLLQYGYDWYVQEVDVNNLVLTSREFIGVFADWKRRVEEYEALRGADAAPASQAPVDRLELYDSLLRCFDLSELEELCFEMSIDDENLKGQEKPAKARALISYCERHSRLDELVTACRKLRPRCF